MGILHPMAPRVKVLDYQGQAQVQRPLEASHRHLHPADQAQMTAPPPMQPCPPFSLRCDLHTRSQPQSRVLMAERRLKFPHTLNLHQPHLTMQVQQCSLAMNGSSRQATASIQQVQRSVTGMKTTRLSWMNFPWQLSSKLLQVLPSS